LMPPSGGVVLEKIPGICIPVKEAGWTMPSPNKPP